MPNWVRGEYEITTDPVCIDPQTVQGWLRETYWARGIPLEKVVRSMEGSECFGVLRDTELVGFARAVTDYATFAWVCDVYIAEPFRGQGLAKWLIKTMREHPQLQRLRRWVLATHDAHEIYKHCGFRSLRRPENWLEIRAEDPYGVDTTSDL
ncbi:MAG: GNAT family N-acetyltransferase [Planctomycetales bacterium]|nr:GNAT family N-acetyltransferase [Planctomycetota bacterium]MCA8945425.1 GNAT family N-acetyltransferase [Planctomycetota bacterium]MCA9179930.1 GNAT family N-acetyltransferase [Planctomycetales bacterium]